MENDKNKNNFFGELLVQYARPSKIQQLEEFHEDIEALRKLGVPVKNIVDHLNAVHNLGISQPAFNVMIHRLRKKRSECIAKEKLEQANLLGVADKASNVSGVEQVAAPNDKGNAPSPSSTVNPIENNAPARFPRKKPSKMVWNEIKKQPVNL